ncbi:Hsp70-Hsp90 organizing protein 3 [Zea mays]|uniref:Hsp70-Hsp90 organizing protein 3 n=3 Tax=Zea mays TaxID=4577 RepID=A0A1D6HEP1_MAIZE|nr:Hsp70-Hsp90 organizing protein 3 [Zea mays]
MVVRCPVSLPLPSVIPDRLFRGRTFENWDATMPARSWAPLGFIKTSKLFALIPINPPRTFLVAPSSGPPSRQALWNLRELDRIGAPAMADEAKAKGNAAFSAGRFEEAARHFTDAIALAPGNHVLYSNRSAALASLHRYSDALADAQKTVELKPDWAKGYSRLGAAHLGLGDAASAVAAYEKGLALDPSNEGLKAGLEDAKKAAAAPPRRGPSGPDAIGQMFQGPELWSKIASDPTTRAYLNEPDFMQMLREVQRNPSSISMYLSDPRMMQVLSLMLNVKIQRPEASEPSQSTPPPPPPQQQQTSPLQTKAREVEPEPEPEPMDFTDEEKERKERKAAAQKEKELGNTAYKKKDFEAAIQHYTKALEHDDEDISYLTNRAAVYIEMGKYDECIKDCDKAVERGRELRADFKMISRALTRKGTALVKLAKTSKDFDIAIETYQKALTEHRNPDTLKKLNEAERAKKELEQQEYYDPKLADEEREKGNEFFKEQKYPEAIKHYTEALKRNPKDPRVYSNRAACYTKLGAMPEGLKDAEKCLELDPTFTKGYTRKGAIQFFMKEYDKAMETYQAGLKHDPKNQELLDGVRRCIEQINKANRGEISQDELQERQNKAMQDPEIQNILTDPIMRQVLNDFQENPRAAQEHLKNPGVMQKIQKLVSAGIVQMR